MNLNQQIITHSTSSITNYTNARNFVENLSNHLKVESELPSGLSMVSVGQNAPDQQYQDVPWLELDENNNPIALKYFNGTTWASLAPDVAIKSQTSGMYIQQGIFEFNVDGSANSNQNSSSTYNNGSNFLFGFPFNANATPVVTVTPMDCTLYDVLESNDANRFYHRLGNIDRFGFNLDYNFSQNGTDISGASPNLKFKFSYIAIGQVD